MKHAYSLLTTLSIAAFATGCCCADTNSNRNQRSNALNNNTRDQNNLYNNQQTQQQIIKNSAYAVVKVLNLGLPKLIRSKNGVYIKHKNKFPVAIPSASHGSGIVISNKCLVATNEHVIRGSASLAVRFEDKKETYAARLIAKSAKHDLALIQVDRPNCPYVKNIMKKPASLDRGSEVWKIGYGGEIPSTAMRARQAAVKQGTYSRMVPDGHGGNRYEISAPINGGDSGGLLIDKNGAVIGMLVAKLRQADGVGFVIPRPLIVGLVGVAAQKGWIKRERNYMKTQNWQTHRSLSTVGAELVETDIKNLVRGNITVRGLNNLYNLIVRDIKARTPNSATIVAMATLSSVEWNYAATLYASGKNQQAAQKVQRAMDLATLAVKYYPQIRTNPYINFVIAFKQELLKRKNARRISANDLPTLTPKDFEGLTSLPTAPANREVALQVNETLTMPKPVKHAKHASAAFPSLD